MCCPTEFVTYLYVYVYDNICKDNNSNFLKSLNPHSWRGTDCPGVSVLTQSIFQDSELVFTTLSYRLCSLTQMVWKVVNPV